jgi:hypothetical protein
MSDKAQNILLVLLVVIAAILCGMAVSSHMKDHAALRREIRKIHETMRRYEWRFENDLKRDPGGNDDLYHWSAMVK